MAIIQKYSIDLIIDSKYRIDYQTTNSNNFKISIPGKIKGTILRYGLKSYAIPNTINTISGSFEIEDSSGVQTVTPTPGFYTAETLRIELEDKLNLLGVDTYVVTLEGSKYRITSSFAGFIVNPNNLSVPNGILYKIGFGTSGVWPSTGGVITSYGSVNLSQPNYIYIDIPQFNKHIKNTNGVLHNFIVPVNSSYGCIISPKNTLVEQFQPYVFNDPSNTNELTVRLKYENGDLIDLNNSDWVFIINLEVASQFNIGP